jgi:hypothetical protein
MSTVATLHPQKQFFTQDIEPIMFVLVGFCMLSHSTEALFEEDQNAFLTQFLDSDDEQITTISIRMQVIELLEDCYF